MTNNTPNNFKTSSEGLKLIKNQEGLRLNAYQNVINGVTDKVTIGYGHTGLLNGRPLKLADKITQTEAERLFKNDLAPFEKTINEAVKVNINQNQFDALISLTYNIGPNAFKNSTLLKLLNKGDFEGAKKEFAKWNKVGGGVVSSGLSRRRADEANLFNKSFSGTTGNTATKTLKGEVKYNDYQGGGGGGGSSTGGAASAQVNPNAETPSMAEDRLKRNPPPTHNNPSNESQHEQYEKERFGQPSAHEGLSEETLKTLFQNPEVLGALGSGIKGAFSSNVPSSEFNPSNITLQGYAETKDFYDPVTKMVNTDPTQRVVLSDGSTLRYGVPILNEESISQPPVASRPYNRETPYSTPNSQSIKDTLYGGVKDYAKGYLYDRGLELAFGKKAAGKIKKAEGYCNTVKTYAPNAWQAASTVLSRTLNSVGYTIGSIAGWVATGVDLAIKAISFIPIIGAPIAAVLSAVAYGVGYAIGASLGAVSWALTALAFLPW